jgi:DNA-directed RNA polymerase subunit RPC12/RpoP
MQLELQCQKCDESFDVDPADLASDPELRCPGCGAKATVDQAEALSNALEELFAAVAALRRKFAITGELDSEDLPSPHDGGTGTLRGKRGAVADEDEESEDDAEDEDE